MNFNINHEIQVKLTDKGREIYQLYLAHLRGQFNPQLIKERYIELKEDKDGYSSWQLWYLMRIFGEHLYAGCDLPFETEVIINEKAQDKITQAR